MLFSHLFLFNFSLNNSTFFSEFFHSSAKKSILSELTF